MINASGLPRRLVIFAIVLPLAALIGYLLSDPQESSLLLIGVMVGVLSIPFFLRHHHLILIASCNMAVSIFFLPGPPPLWMIAALISLSLTLLHRILDKHKHLLGDAWVGWSLIALGIVVLVTMKMTTGIGLRSIGARYYGGSKYFFILFAIVAYFALSSQPIPAKKANSYIGAFYLTGVTPIFSHIVYLLGPSMWFLYAFFQVEYAVGQAMEDITIGGLRIGRLAGLASVGLALFSFIITRFGVRGVLDWTKPWRALALATAIGISLFGGFRSITVYFVAVLVIQFCLEGLHKTRLMLIVLVTGVLSVAAMAPFSRHLPLPVQRCLTIVPGLDLNPAMIADAKGSTDWRLRMWEVLWAEVPKYLVLGKGCAADQTDYYLAAESFKRGLAKDTEMYIVAGDFHNGPLSVLISFGIFGVLAFVAFLIAALRVLLRNYHYGDPGLKHINTFLLASFIAKIAFFMVLFGAIHSDLIVFVSLVGLSVSLNRGVRKPAVQAEPAPAAAPRGAPSLRPARA